MTGKFDFSLDLPYGQEGEAYVKDMLRGVFDSSDVTVEVKRDARALGTGNVYLEYSQLPQGHPPWRKSGLAITEASYFAVVIGNMIIIAPTDAWKWVGNQSGVKRETGGDNPTRGVCVPLGNLPKRLSEAPF